MGYSNKDFANDIKVAAKKKKVQPPYGFSGPLDPRATAGAGVAPFANARSGGKASGVGTPDLSDTQLQNMDLMFGPKKKKKLLK